MYVSPQGVPIHLANLRNLSLRNPSPEQFYNERPLRIEFILIFIGLAPDRTSQNYAFSLLSGQRLFGPLTDKVALNLRREAKCEGQHLALNVLPKPLIVLYGPDTTLLCHADIENLHNHKQVTPQPGQLGTDNQIVFLHPVQEFSQFPLAVTLRTADGLLNPSVNAHRLTGTEIIDFKPLIFDSLFVAADSDVTVNHTVTVFIVLVYRKLAISTRDKITETFNKTSHGYSVDIPTPPPLHRIAAAVALGSFLLFPGSFLFLYYPGTALVTTRSFQFARLFQSREMILGTIVSKSA